jgi:hypothetical protein
MELGGSSGKKCVAKKKNQKSRYDNTAPRRAIDSPHANS